MIDQNMREMKEEKTARIKKVCSKCEIQTRTLRSFLFVPFRCVYFTHSV